MPHELWVFPIWLVKADIILDPVWALALFPFISTESCFSGLGWFLHMQVSGSLFMQISLLWYPALGHLPTFISPLNSVSSLQEACGLPLFFPSVPLSGISHKTANYGNNGAYWIDSPSLRNHCTLFLDFHCLENFNNFFLIIWFWGVNLVLVFSSWPEIEVVVFLFLFLSVELKQGHQLSMRRGGRI